MTECFKTLIEGYKAFQVSAYPSLKKDFVKLADEGQSPKVLFITCCDSRVDPSLIFQAKPGELFVIRNVASLVPPFEQGDGYHGVSAAVEFAVNSLKVKHIVVMSHTMCGGIQAMVESVDPTPTTFIGQWMTLGLEAKERAAQEICTSHQEHINLASRFSSLSSLKNLRTFPWIQEKEEQGILNLHAWQFDIRSGEIVAYNAETQQFQELHAYWQDSLCGLDACKPGSVLQKQG